ncbi:FAD-binding oxidoreductase [Kitasatospora sp. LaBMicrA B282]|uniref:FAD-binding oxidoreductase n=1 Tax=Kitasatospora sp. LaBMicrA B282 TaxID=3420949 RepID=UPI003D0BCD11
MIGISGPVFRPGDDGYDGERLGYNLALDQRPALVVGARAAADVAAAVRHAAGAGLGVAVQATGHGISAPTDGHLVVDTSRMRGVTVDPVRRTVLVEAGVRWHEVLGAVAPHGLAPLSGSNPEVGVVGYTLGGGIGLLGRRYGYAADRVRRMTVVTADGQLREVSAEREPDLFWGLRGGKDNLGIVVAMELDLVPVARIFGGGLYFPGESAAEVLHAYAAWTETVPEEMSSSIQLIQYPELPVLPEPLRGRFVAHVRIAWCGATAAAEPWVRPLRALGPTLLDTLREMPVTETGSIHHEPPMPVAAYDRNTALRELAPGAVDTLLELAGPQAEAPVILEIRHHGGAYARMPEVPNAVGGRDAAFMVFSTFIMPPATLPDLREVHATLHDKIAPWGTGGSFVNFLGIDDATPDRVRACYAPADYRRLAALKASYDPANLFRVNYNIPPAGAAS